MIRICKPSNPPVIRLAVLSLTCLVSVLTILSSDYHAMAIAIGVTTADISCLQTNSLNFT